MNTLNLKLAYRSAMKNKTVSLAKIFGLSLSFAVIFFAASYIYYETSFDKHVPDKDRIFRSYMYGQLNLEKVNYAVTSPAMAQGMIDEVPEIKDAVRIFNRGEASFMYNDLNHDAGGIYQVDTNFFTFFSIPFKSTTRTPLEGNDDIAMAKTLAIKYFGSEENALGKSISIRGGTATITTVFEDFPKTSHIQFNLAQSIHRSFSGNLSWDSQNLYTYYKTHHEIENIDALDFKLTQLVYSHSDQDMINPKEAKTWEDLKYGANYYIFYLSETLTDIHFSNHKFDSSITSNKTYVYGTLIIALLILIVSSLNFLNLNLAAISLRLKQIGVQKTNGAAKVHVFTQFIQETNLYWLISLIIAILVFMVFSQPFSNYIGLGFDLEQRQIASLLFILSVILLLVNILVNVFPVFLVSRKGTLNLLRGKYISGNASNGNNGLVFIQFAISLIIVIGAFFVQKQIDYMVTKDRGYDTENILMFHLWNIESNQRSAFVEELKNYPEVFSVTCSNEQFGSDPSMTSAFFHSPEDGNYFHTSAMRIDANFADVYNIEMAEGRFFDKSRTTDVGKVIINEAAVREYTGNNSLVGSNLIFNGTREVVGIAKDFNFRSLHHKVEPLVMECIQNQGNISVKFSQDKAGELTRNIQHLWNEFNVPGTFDPDFHNEQLAHQYESDVQAKKLMSVLSLISFIIAAVGLYAVSMFSISRKTKEIGVHKVNGAKVNELMLIINKKFILWIFMAIIVSVPLSYLVIQLWLNNFAYSTPMVWWVFLLAGSLTFLIAILTVGFQSWRAAARNPVEALRYE